MHHIAPTVFVLSIYRIHTTGPSQIVWLVSTLHLEYKGLLPLTIEFESFIHSHHCWSILQSNKYRTFSLVNVTMSSGSCFSSQPVFWDCVQQKMRQAVNYHTCSGKWHFIGRSLSPIMCLLRNSQSVNVQIANPPRAQLLTGCCQ